MLVVDFTDGGDDGAELERRIPCAVRTWCVLEHGHTSACVEVPRETNHERQDWDKRTPDPRGWGEAQRKRNR